MQKILTIKYNGIHGKIVSDELEEKFFVHDSDKYPDFDAIDYLRAVRYGIELAKQGYDEVIYVSK